MRLIKMRLENFQGATKTEVDFQGLNTNIYGDNATGKTTISNAFFWLIFGKSSEGKSDYSPKTRTFEGCTSGLDHSVECDIEINGRIISFRRVYHEVWKKSRGSTKSVLSGHTTDYFIDGVPKKEKEYIRYWEHIFGNDEVQKILSMPLYFASDLHWEKRRNVLLDLCGAVSDNEIIGNDAELKQLFELLDGRTIDEYKKVLKASLKDINQKMQSIPERLDEAHKAIPDTSDYSDPIKQLEILRSKIVDAEEERASVLTNNNPVASVEAEIGRLNCLLMEKRIKHLEEQQNQKNELYEAENRCRGEMLEAENKLTFCKHSLEKSKFDLDDILEKRNYILAEHRKFREEHNSKQTENFDETATICITCGQTLPQEKIKQLKETFNVNKSDRLTELKKQMDSLVEQGKKEASKEMLALAQETFINAEKSVKKAEVIMLEAENKFRLAVQNCRQFITPTFEETKEHGDLIQQINYLKAKKTNVKPDTSEIDMKLSEYRREEKVLNSAIAALETKKIQNERIAQLENQSRELGKAYEKAKYSLYLCEKFSTVKSKFLTEKINSHFDKVSFQLFEKNITNDGINDICEVLVQTDGGARVPFKDSNDAAKVNAGIEIIGVLSKHYDLKLPLFIDNAERVTRLKEIDSQMIRLIVSENDKKLRVEVAKTKGEF